MVRRAWRGFSIVELLIVIGIIALLVGILLPGLGKARENARRVQCMSNVRQLTIAWLTYANDNKGHFCSSQVQGAPGYEADPNSWYCTYDVAGATPRPMRVDVTFGGFKTPPPGYWSWVGGGGNVSAKDGMLWPYVRSMGAYTCPDDPLGRSPDYQINGLLGGSVGIPTTLFAMPQIRRPESTFVFIEGWSKYGVLWTCFKTPVYPKNVLNDVPGQNHKGSRGRAEGTVISFADGHAMFWAYSDPRTGILGEAISGGLANSIKYNLTDPTKGVPITNATDFNPNSPDLYQLEAWSGGPRPPNAIR